MNVKGDNEKKWNKVIKFVIVTLLNSYKHAWAKIKFTFMLIYWLCIHDWRACVKMKECVELWSC